MHKKFICLFQLPTYDELSLRIQLHIERSMSKDHKSAPNVLFISVDQWPGHLMGCAGHPVIQTPTLDHLAKLGTRFTRAYAESPICIPSRRSMMTGLSPRGHGDRSFNPTLPLKNLPLLAQSFRSAGYQSVAIGKLHVYPPRDRIGFDDVLLAEEGRPKLGAIDDYEMYLASQGHPIAGDDKYGDFEWNKALNKQGLKRMFLHAWRLEFTHPATGKRITLKSPLPPELQLYANHVKSKSTPAAI